MYNLSTLKNGLTLITIDLPYLDSVTTMVAVGAGSRYENAKNNGISHFLEHMFFKGSKKYPTAEIIQTTLDGVGAIDNAATSREYTYYYIKSASTHIELASDILSSSLLDSLLQEEEIEKEKGVIVEEIRMGKDNPIRHVWNLYEELQFGNHPLGRTITGTEKIVSAFDRKDFVQYIESLYSSGNMALIYVGKLPKNIKELAEKYFGQLPARPAETFTPYKKQKQTKPKVRTTYKKIDQANVILGVECFGRHDPRRYVATVLEMILAGGMSSRLFLEVREKRGLAYRIGGGFLDYMDTGAFIVSAGLKLEKLEEGIRVIKSELHKLAETGVSDEELKKVKDMEKGRTAIRCESTNFLAEHFGLDFVLDRKLETFEEYLKSIDAVTAEDVQKLAKELFQNHKFNLQILGPVRDPKPFEKILSS